MKKRDNMKDTKLKNFNPMALREKYSAQSRVTNYSSFWSDNDISRTSIFDDEETKKGNDLVALASYRRAISNFVSIVTGDSDIKVTFTSQGDSYTDGKAVTISSKLDDKLFDSTVGLALHEGSHINYQILIFLNSLRITFQRNTTEELKCSTFKDLKQQIKLRTYLTMLKIEELIILFFQIRLAIKVTIIQCMISIFILR